MSNPSLRLACLTILSTGLLAAGIVACSSDSKNNATTDAGPTNNQTDAGGNTNEGGSGNDTDGGDSGSGGGGNGITSCTTATLFAGNPLYDGQPSDRPTDGTGILADPPFQWGNLTFDAAGKFLYTRDTGEVWYTDTTAANPVEKRLFGKNPSGTTHIDIKFGACSTALAGAINGMEVLQDGSLVMVDAFANDVIHVKDPQGAGCTVESWAGTNADVGFDDTDYPNLGDMDGVVGTSKIGYPTAITSDGAGTVYFYDGYNQKIKKIANDANHTVTTIGKQPNNEDIVYGMVHIGTTIYWIGYDSNNTVVYKMADGHTMTKVAGGGPDQWDGLGNQGPQLGGITTDGKNLIVAGKGIMWLVDVTSGKITRIAGSGDYIDIPADAKNPTTADKVTLKPRNSASEAAVGSPDYLGFKAGAVYYRGQGQGTAAYVEKIQCQ